MHMHICIHTCTCMYHSVDGTVERLFYDTCMHTVHTTDKIYFRMSKLERFESAEEVGLRMGESIGLR